MDDRNLNTDDQDQFTKLPEPLIIEILSKLDLKDAVKTGVLAKNWRNLWIQVYNIVLRYHPEYVDNNLSLEEWKEIRKLQVKRWVSSVDHTLTQCTSTHINSFCLTSSYLDVYNISHRLISYALDKNVKILELSCWYLPTQLFQSSSITSLKLCFVGKLRLSSVGLSSLKILHMDYACVGDVSLEKILMGCPVLEELYIGFPFSYCLRHINIMFPSVKTFKLGQFKHVRPDGFLNIKAPWLQELEISGEFVTGQCQLVDVSSLTKATLTMHTKTPSVNMLETDDWEYNDEVTQYNYQWIPMVRKLLGSTSHVVELVIGSEPIQVLTLSKVLAIPSPVFKCKHLSIETYLWKHELPGIVCLLENAPHLETLFIKVLDEWWQYDAYPLYQANKLFEDGDPHLEMPNGKLVHLKNVTIDYWRFPCGDDDSYGEYFDFELVDYILRSCIVLEKLVLYSSSGRCLFECSLPNCAFQYINRLSSKVATFLSGDEGEAEWKLNKSKNKFVFSFSNYASLHP